MTNSQLNVPPFPPLQWDGYSWVGSIKLPSWTGFQCRLGPYASVSAEAPSDGTTQLRIESPNEEAQAPPSLEQAAAFNLLIDHDQAISMAILQALLDSYPSLCESYGYDDAEAAAYMPPVASPDEFQRLIGLSFVHILTESKDGIAYFGLEFGCTWDEEHGLGVMMHKNRVIELGGADTAFLGWIAEKDANV
jgi:hypothetical protein